jgi:hypothetical protein
MALVDDWNRLSRTYLQEGRGLTRAQHGVGATLYPAWFQAGLGGVWTLTNVVRLLDDDTASAVCDWAESTRTEFLQQCARPENSSSRARAGVAHAVSGGAPLTWVTAWRLRELSPLD